MSTTQQIKAEFHEMTGIEKYLTLSIIFFSLVSVGALFAGVYSLVFAAGGAAYIAIALLMHERSRQ